MSEPILSKFGEVKKFSMEYAGRLLTIEVGKMAKQTNGSCLVQYGETVVLATAVRAKEPREGTDFFPLLVDYEEKLYAAGKIKGSRWIKREGKATDEAILNARIIDRSIRPLFKDSERRDVQVMITVLAVDGDNDPDIASLIAASCALSISDIPWNGPMGAIRIGQINGEWVLNGSYDARDKSDFDLFLAGNQEEVVMIEAAAKQVQEEVISSALTFAHKHLKKVVAFIADIQSQIGHPKDNVLTSDNADEQLARQKIESLFANDLTNVFHADKQTTQDNIAILKEKVDQTLKDDNEVSKEVRAKALGLLDEYLATYARQQVLENGQRPDGRGPEEIRHLSAEVGLLPRVHGSALFSRGETQVLSIVTLGAPGDKQELDGMEEEGKKRYMHHYNFPGFSVGEVKPSRGPSRRDIGHGALAEKALIPVIPKEENFPYTIRVVSEVLGSNGSSSQAAICGSTMALMDAGVPIVAPVAGISIGLVADIKDKNNYVLLTDIQGLEDHSFDMDFKVAGSKNGITAIQLDIKLGGISLEICKNALIRAKSAREQVLEVMSQAIAVPRPELSQYAPRIITLHIDPEKIRDVIGSGGKIINKIIDDCGVQIDIEQDGTVFITSTSASGAQKAQETIESIVKEIEVGETYEGQVIQIVKGKDNGEEIGAIVQLTPHQDGMIHVSNLDWRRVGKVTDVVNVGDTVKVKVIEVDKEKGRISLSRKELLEKPANYSEAGSRFGQARRFTGPLTKSRPFNKNHYQGPQKNNNYKDLPF
jgi:polyribonucleotide nucleotidyltransferase